MARAVKWQMNFSSVNNNQYVVKIYEDGYSGTPIPLIGASSPFYTEEEKDEDIFTPIRQHTGNITLIADENTDSLIPADNYAHYVTLDSGGAILWQGFMIPQSFSQPWDAKPYEIDFQVQSPISLLSSKQMDMSKGLGSISLRNLIIEAFTECGISDLYDTFSIDNYMTSTVIITLLAFKVSRFNWFEENKTEDDGTGEWQKFIGKSYYTMMKDILSFLGLTMRERGKTIYLKAIDSWTYRFDKTQTSVLTIPFANFLAKNGSWTMRTYEALSFDSISPASTKNTIDIVPGRNKITITANTNKIGELLNNFKITNYDLVDQKTYYTNSSGVDVPDSSRASYFFKCRLRSNTCVGNDVTCHVYNEAPNSPAEVSYPTAVTLNARGCTIMDVDCYRIADITAGKDNYSYDSGFFNNFIHIFKWQTGATPDMGWNDNVAMSVSSSLAANYTNGYLCLSGSTQFYVGPKYGKRIGKGYFTFGIRVGDKYWNGSAWTTLPSTFLVKQGQPGDYSWHDTGSGQILSTKTLAMDCNASGYMIPVNTELSGDIEIRLISSFQYVLSSGETEDVVPDFLRVILKDLNLEYFSLESDSFNSNTVNTYAKIINKSFNDDKSVSLNIATSQNNKDGYAVLKNDTIPATFLQYNINNNVNWFRPEEFLLDRMFKHYQDNVKYLTIDTVFPHEVIVNKKLKDSNNVLWAPISESHSWAENICKYKLITINDK